MNPDDPLFDLASAMSLSVIICMAMAITWCKVVDLWDYSLQRRGIGTSRRVAVKRPSGAIRGAALEPPRRLRR